MDIMKQDAENTNRLIFLSQALGVFLFEAIKSIFNGTTLFEDDEQ